MDKVWGFPQCRGDRDLTTGSDNPHIAVHDANRAPGWLGNPSLTGATVTMPGTDPRGDCQTGVRGAKSMARARQFVLSLAVRAPCQLDYIIGVSSSVHDHSGSLLPKSFCHERDILEPSIQARQ